MKWCPGGCSQLIPHCAAVPFLLEQLSSHCLSLRESRGSRPTRFLRWKETVQ